MKDWQSTIDRRIARVGRASPLMERVEQLTSDCLEIVMSELNERLCEHQQPPILLVDGLPDEVMSSEQRYLGLYPVVKRMVMMTLSTDPALSMRDAALVAAFSHSITSEARQEALQQFIERHPQLQAAEELSDPVLLAGMIEECALRVMQDVIAARPANPVPEPPRGRMV